MHKKLFLPLFLLFAMLGGTVKAAPAMLQAHGIGVVVNDTIIDDDEEIVVDLPINNQQVEYIGGAAALCAFINSKTRYPQIALETETQGEAVVEFCVKEDGTIGEVFMLKSLSPECDKALIDAVRKLKRFIPAKRKGKPVPVWFKMSVSFNMSDDNDNDKPIREIKSETGKVVEVIHELKASVRVQYLDLSDSRFDQY